MGRRRLTRPPPSAWAGGLGTTSPERERPMFTLRPVMSARAFLPGLFVLAPHLLLAAGPAPAPIPAGAGEVEVRVGGHRLALFTYKPKNYGRSSPLIVVFHGMLRNADAYRDNARGMADRFGAPVVAPRLDLERFPIEAYQLGGVQKGGADRPPDQWTLRLVQPLVEEVRRREGRPAMPCLLIGHSAGGQFLSRLAGLVACDATRIVAANPGTHLWPGLDLPFPYGYGRLPEGTGGEAALRRYLARPLTIYLGTADTGDEDLLQTPEAMRQGRTRYERGQNCFAAAQALAQARGWAFNWR